MRCLPLLNRQGVGGGDKMLVAVIIAFAGRGEVNDDFI